MKSESEDFCSRADEVETSTSSYCLQRFAFTASSRFVTDKNQSGRKCG